MKIWRVPYPKFGDGPALERVAALAAHLKIELAKFGERGAVIVGSNGKGSTAAMTAALLRQAGQPVGLFTSPHLFVLNERFAVDGEAIENDELEMHWARVAAAIEALALSSKVGGFEFLFLIAASWFAARDCTHTVWEAGIGGRLDPVRLIRAKNVALTSLDLEHTHLLGETLEKIGLDKIAVAPPGANLFAAIWTAEKEALARQSARAGVRYVTVAPYPGVDLPLAGEHQNQNASLAMHLAMSITGLDEEGLAPGFVAARWPGRLETLQTNPLVIVDVGHSPAAIEAALEGFHALQGQRDGVLVCGASRDKDVSGIVAALAPGFPRIICASAAHKGASAVEIAACAAAANPAAEISIADSVAEARRLALEKACTEGAIYVAGGLFLAAEFRAVHLGRDPGNLVFF